MFRDMKSLREEVGNRDENIAMLSPDACINIYFAYLIFVIVYMLFIYNRFFIRRTKSCFVLFIFCAVYEFPPY